MNKIDWDTYDPDERFSLDDKQALRDLLRAQEAPHPIKTGDSEQESTGS